MSRSKPIGGGPLVRRLVLLTAALVVAASGLAVSAQAKPTLATRTSTTTLTTSTSTVTALPADRIVFDSNRTGNYEVFTMLADGSSPVRLTNDPTYDSWWPKISPDRTKILFYRTPKGTHDRDYSKTSLWQMNADGTALRQLLANGSYGWTFQGHAEWSPDGTQLVMLGGSAPGTQIYITNADGTSPRLVKKRGGSNVDPSWSPDGKSLLFIGCPVATCTKELYEVFRINTDGTGEQRLTNDLVPDYDPYYSPDGSTIAWLRDTGGLTKWGVFRMNPDGSGQRPVIDDGGINSKPAWSADSQTIFFHRAAPGHLSYSIWTIHPDGSGLTQRPTRTVDQWGDEYPTATTH